jgi:hypothetical protein
MWMNQGIRFAGLWWSHGLRLASLAWPMLRQSGLQWK